MRKKTELIVIIGVAILIVFISCSKEKAVYTIGINQFMQHPLLDDVTKGIIDELADQGISDDLGSKIILKNANGDQSVAVQINKQFVDQQVSVIVPLGTPPAQSAFHTTKTIPIVFGAVTDPIKAGIIENLDIPGGNITGTSDRWPYAKQISLIRELVPQAQKVGIILNPGESNTEASMAFINPSLEKHGFQKIEVPVSSTSEVYGAAQSLIGRCDVILVPADNTVVSAIDAVVKTANDNKIPLFAGNTSSVKAGAIATYGVNYYKIGRKTGEIIVKILKDQLDPGAISVVVESEANLVINLSAAKKQGINIPNSMIEMASEVFEE